MNEQDKNIQKKKRTQQNIPYLPAFFDEQNVMENLMLPYISRDSNGQQNKTLLPIYFMYIFTSFCIRRKVIRSTMEVWFDECGRNKNFYPSLSHANANVDKRWHMEV